MEVQDIMSVQHVPNFVVSSRRFFVKYRKGETLKYSNEVQLLGIEEGA